MANVISGLALLCSVICLGLLIILVRQGKNGSNKEESLKDTEQRILKGIEENKAVQSSSFQMQTKHMESSFKLLQESIQGQIQQMQRSIATMTESNERQIQRLSDTVQKSLESLKQQNEKSLSEIKQTVDQQLQDTLEKKLNLAFDSVVKQLNQVERGLGEMQSLANNVGDLKKTLSNVKTRGILGEIQLGAILEQILSPEQYEENVATVKGSTARVEYAVKLPGVNGNRVYLPIDAKFPGDTYHALLEAYETGDASLIAERGKLLDTRIMEEAKDIATKYIHVPETTEFAILFLPFEGLYAEVVRRGLVEKLQEKYKVNIAGPTTMAALLNSLQMGFQTLAIQKRSNEVWEILGNVKSEFSKYQKCIEGVQKKLNQASIEFETLVGTRTRMLNRQLDQISSGSALEEQE